jgi:hypothetical protein
MPETDTKNFALLQPLIKREILRINNAAGNLGQYRGNQRDVHGHEGIGTPQILHRNVKGVDGILVSNTISLSSPQILALNTTPIVLVQNPGPRSFIFVDGIAGRLAYNGTAYSGTNNLEFRYTNGSGLKVCADMPSTFLNSASSTYSYSPWQVDYDRNVDSNFTPVAGDTGNNGQVVVSVPTANPTIPGLANLTVTSNPLIHDTSNTLSAPWPFASGTVVGIFADGETRNITVTSGSTAISWSPGLAASQPGTPGLTIKFQGLTGSIGSLVILTVFYRTVAFAV